MINGIFHQWLDHQFDDLPVKDFFIYINDIFQLIPVAELLDRQIIAGILDLPLYRDDLILIADALAEKLCQRRSHLHHFFIFSTLCHPDDGIQRIIKEMRIDLCLKRLKLTFSLLFLFTDIFRHQILDLLCHDIEGMGQTGDLIAALRTYQSLVKLSLLHIFHRLFQFLDRFCDLTGKPQRQKQRKDAKAKCDQQIEKLDLGAILHKLQDIRNTDYRPACLIRFKYGIQLTPPVLCGQEVPRPVFQHLIDELRFHAAVQQLLLGMIDDLSFFAHDKQVAFAPQIHIGTKLLNGTVVHVYKKDPLYLMRSRIDQSFAQRDHPLIFSPDGILDM